MIIKNKIITIFGDPGSGKTFLASFLAYHYYMQGGVIFSNIVFSHFGKKINKTIQKITDIKYIPYQEKKGLIIIDEGGLNINSRRSISNDNLEFAELTFLGRKINCDIIYIAQLDYSIDRYIRDLSSCSIYMKSYYINPQYLGYTMQIKKKDYLIGYKEIDLITFAELTNFRYSTLESSKIQKNKELKELAKKEKQELKELGII